MMDHLVSTTLQYIDNKLIEQHTTTTTTTIILNSVKHFHNIINWHNK